jgi:DNA-binding NtrC family response regulator
MIPTRVATPGGEHQAADAGVLQFPATRGGPLPSRPGDRPDVERPAPVVAPLADSPPGRVTLVDGPGGGMRLVEAVLEAAGWHVTLLSLADGGPTGLSSRDGSVILWTLDADSLPALESLLQPVRGRRPVVIAITETGASSLANRALALGAFGTLQRPLRTEQLLKIVEQAREQARVPVAVPEPATPAPLAVTMGRAFVGDSPSFRALLHQIERVAPLKATVLITGESGTGKELVARAVHALSQRHKGPFVPVHCSALSANLLESELFGHVKGSFTGAVSDRRGLFEEASGGTLFLDEIGTITIETQVKLLRVLQERRVQRVGANAEREVDFRLVGATNVDLAEEVSSSRFREDLYYRLNVFPIRVPPLRERREDIPLLVEHVRARFAAENDIEAPEVPPDALDAMMSYDWPGNVRELENAVERALIMHVGQSKVSFAAPAGATVAPALPLIAAAEREQWTLDRLGREYTDRVLQQMGGCRTAAAKVLGISRRTLHRMLLRDKTLGLGTSLLGN